ncbi:uncharacterized protein LOC125494837 [Beta vulgaris subsp. vulgaris]|uniref:uncharacterized protein LOC125494837 n=1 Tax=Beta vulgaris subsp. vulgaris TaxID=3555 RepID=UPI0025484234|nr:uncharacterized protein LOC125494837 [Beta vulgaris subsp. vulgaris]
MNETNVVAKSESDEEENIAQRRRRRGPRDNLNPYQRRMLRMGQGGVNAEVGGQKGERSGDVGDGGSEEHGYVGGKGVGGSEEEHENEEGDGQEEEEQGARVEEEEERQEEGERVEGQQEGERQEEEGERVEGREEEERQGEEGERVEGQQEGGERLEGQQEEGERVEGQQEGGERVEGQQEGERQEEEGERVEGLEEEERLTVGLGDDTFDEINKSRYEWASCTFKSRRIDSHEKLGDNISGDKSCHGNEEVSGSVSQTTELSQTSVGSKGNKSRSRKRRCTRPSVKLREKDFVVEMVPRSYPNYMARILRLVAEYDTFEAQDHHPESLVLVKCGDYTASLSDCYTVLNPNVELATKYVSVVGAMYTRLWAKKLLMQAYDT